MDENKTCLSDGFNAADLIEALNSVTWYNGLAEKILEWKKPGVVDVSKYGTHLFGLKLQKWFEQFERGDQAQLQVFWMIGILLYGNYGTSPRTGWIDDWDGFMHFLDAITEAYRESIEEMTP